MPLDGDRVASRQRAPVARDFQFGVAPAPNTRQSGRVARPICENAGMRLVAGLLLACCALASCEREDPFAGGPELGPSPGEVRLSFASDPAPGEQVTLDIEVTSERTLKGGTCIDLYRWQPGYGPEVDWHIDLRSGDATADLPEPPACPTDGTDLPSSLSFALPPLEGNVYQLTYTWSDVEGQQGPTASLTFEVDAD